MSTAMSQRATAIRQNIKQFIEERFEQKTERLAPGSEKYEKEKQAHEYLPWMEHWIRKVQSLQVVTHPLKATYPDAHVRETVSLFCFPCELSEHGLVSSASLKENFEFDVTGDAGALTIFRLLMREFEGKTLLTLCLESDPDMQSALHPDSEQGKEWMESLASITQPKTNEIISHGLAKQIFWLAGDDPYEDEDFVLLQPFFSSALSHQVYQQIREDKFGEAATEARKAREKNLPSERSLKVYLDMGVQHLGGTKPQNISYLNSVQRGANYLLSSCPPLWGASSLKPILFQENAFNRFGWKNSARWGWDAHYWLEALKQFLKENPAPILQTRQRVKGMLDGLIGELLSFTRIHHELSAGWTASNDCHLPIEQQCWLDPERGAHDSEFALLRENEDWQTAVEQDFARWLNHELGRDIEFLGDIEFRRWAKELSRHGQWRAEKEARL